MPYTAHAHYFLFFCLAVSLALLYFILQPFVGPLIVAAVFAFLFYPLYQKLLSPLRSPSLAALTTTLSAIVLVLLPVIFLGTQIFKESTQLYQALAGGNAGVFITLVEQALEQGRILFSIPADFQPNFGEYARQGLQALIQNFGGIFSSVAKMLLNAFVFVAAFYFFLKDGPKLKDYLVDLSPLADSDDERIVSRLTLAVSAAVKGSLTIGLIQGTLTGIGFWIFGVPNPALWGGVAAVSALIPGIGTMLVIVPGILFLFFTGNMVGATGLLVWGSTAVGLVDNLLGPKLVGRGMQLHPLAVFLTVLGGLAFFGPLGFLLGPLSMSVALALIEIYASFKHALPKSN